MTKVKNYNINALLGGSDTDLETRDVLNEVYGYNIPVEVCNTPKFPEYVINETYKSNLRDLPNVINEATGVNYTDKEAKREATILRDTALKNLKEIRK